MSDYNSGTNQLHSITPTSNSYNYAYSGAGNTTHDYYGTWEAERYVYDQSQRLYTPMPDPTGYGLPSSYNYYDADGNRQGKSTNVYWDYMYGTDGSFAEERNTVGQLIDYVYLDGQPVALNMIQSGPPATEITYYVHTDRLGTPQSVTNGSQGYEWKALTTPFGLNVSGYPQTTTNVIQHLRFPGQQANDDNSLNHNGQREYRPELGRYLQTDSIGLDAGTTNTYAYANDNPLRFVDPSGLDFITPTEETAILNNPVLKFIGDNPNGGWYIMAGGATLLTGGLAADICEIQAGRLFGTRFGGNTPLLNSSQWLRIGWSYVPQTGEYTFRIGGDLIGEIKADPHITLWPPKYWFTPPTP